jgi:hypothetical protein
VDAEPLVVGSKPSWGETTGSTENSPVMCCSRVDFSPQWTPDLERVEDFPPVSSWYLWPQYNPQWIFYLGWCVVSDVCLFAVVCYQLTC